MQAVQNLAGVRGESGEDLWTAAAHAHQANRRLWVCLGLGVKDQIGGIYLGFPSRWYVVSVSAALAVVDAGPVSV